MHLIPLLVWISAPVAIVKAGISVLHAVIAALNLGTIDVMERQQIRQQSQQTIDKKD
jgi:CDP-diacylglycerol--inositol 3-phosphatidyltransferase